MGNISKKYHVTDDGKIFSVRDDGSVSEIGNISQLSENLEQIVEKRAPNIWKWVAIIIIILLIIMTITFSINKNDSDRYIYYCQDRVGSLEDELQKARDELSNKNTELDSIKYHMEQARLKRIPITITSISFANENQYSQLIDSYGSKLYANRMCFLKPKISYIGHKNGTYNLTEKIYRPNGSDASPSDGTNIFQVSSSKGRSDSLELVSLGWANPGNYTAGEWRFEVWYDNDIIYSQPFTIY